jgi:hypothetical protein
MNTLEEQRLVNAHRQGRRDQNEGRALTVPVYLNDEEQDAYRAGYLGEQRRNERTKP